jgi:hypothetical protein
MAINEKKFKSFASKLYRGENKLLKKQSGNSSFDLFASNVGKPEREGIRSSQRKTIMERAKNKCEMCKRDYEKDLFSIHHVDGDRSHTTRDNLALLCKSCHRKVHRETKAKFQDAKIKNTRKKGKSVTINDFLGVSISSKKTKGPNIHEMIHGKQKKGNKSKGPSFDDLIGF